MMYTCHSIYFHFIPSASSGGGEKLLINTLRHIRGKHVIICMRNSGDLIEEYKRESDAFFCITQLTSIFYYINKALVSSESKIVFQGWMYHGDLFASIFRTIFIFNQRIVLRYFFLNTFSPDNNISLPSRLTRLLSILYTRFLKVEVLAISNASLKSHSLLPYRANSSRVIIPYVENKCHDSLEELLVKRRLRRTKDLDLRLIMVARLDPIKNHYIIFKALNHLRNFSIDLYGNGTDQSNEKLKHLIDSALDRELHSKIRCNGVVSNIQSSYAYYDYIVLPSLSEGLPLALIEASMHGLPSICSNVGDVKQATQEKGLYFENNNLNSLIDCLEHAADLVKDDNNKSQFKQEYSKTKYAKISEELFLNSQSLWDINSLNQSFSCI